MVLLDSKSGFTIISTLRTMKGLQLEFIARIGNPESMDHPKTPALCLVFDFLGMHLNSPWKLAWHWKIAHLPYDNTSTHSFMDLPASHLQFSVGSCIYVWYIYIYITYPFPKVIFVQFPSFLYIQFPSRHGELSQAVLALQEAAEAYLVGLFEAVARPTGKYPSWT